ncbi:hypothetical protein MVES_003145 [Malassezia vespertilionis]|uniref:SET domain-containing protein n=1 Tax=Malassezia vespertilionis TaxID=2020962 RepID=A0A2N1J8S1_9BASI|nr:hypothetical protein MVES_003145 [Malassezia vespertilionis]
MSFAEVKAKRKARDFFSTQAHMRANEANKANDTPYAHALQGTSLYVVHTENYGRGLAVGSDAKPGDVLLRTTPHVSVLHTNQVQDRCYYCFRKRPIPLDAWDAARHCDECGALQRWASAARDAGQASVDPGADVRALAQMLWQRRHHGTHSNWWQQYSAMEARPTEDADAAQLAFQLARFVSMDADPATSLRAFECPDAESLLSMIGAYTANAFMLSDPQLDPIGVSISPVAALCNHSCTPNAVVVFPSSSSSRTMQLVSLKPIRSGEQVWTSYVDLMDTYAHRQHMLQARYMFTCSCPLCTLTTCGAPHWTDPRTSLWCRVPGCRGFVATPRLDADRSDTGACNAAEALAEMAQHDAAAIPYTKLLSMVAWLSELVPPANTLLWRLLYTMHLLAIERAQTDASSWGDAAQLTMLLCAGAQTCANKSDPESAVYPRGHPVRAMLLTTLGKLLVQVTSVAEVRRTPLFSGAPALPADVAQTACASRGDYWFRAW